MDAEWQYVYLETLGIMLGDGEPDDGHKSDAAMRADEHVARLSEMGVLDEAG